jgi:hypothetical protein
VRGSATTLEDAGDTMPARCADHLSSAAGFSSQRRAYRIDDAGAVVSASLCVALACDISSLATIGRALHKGRATSGGAKSLARYGRR